MLKSIRKIKKHGIKSSYSIVRRKFSVIFKKIIIKAGRYNFNHKRNFLEDVFNQFIKYFDNLEICKDLNITLTGNENIARDNNFFLLGVNYAFGEKINWHFNSAAIEKSYPASYSSDINILNYQQFGDYRITWELNRHHHFVWYAQNYFLIKDEKYKELFLNQLKHWISVNKPGYGINFVSPMEISIRLINWVIAILIFYQANERKILLDFAIIDSLLGQLLYLNDNLFIKTRKFRNNHSIVELVGLILIQSIVRWNKIPDLKKLYGWLFEELDQQFYDDGINFEHSPDYFRFTIESLFILLIFVREKEVEKQNQKLFVLANKYSSALRKFLTPGNSVPHFSDSDNGRVLFLSGCNKDFNDFKGFFDFCGIFFDDHSYFISKSLDDFSNETKWWSYLANSPNRDWELNSGKRKTSFFPDGGYYIYRDNEIFLVFKSGYPGNKNLAEAYAPHAHNDLLSFELYINREPVFKDSGTYTYNLFDNDLRTYFRSVYAHNTIIVNGKNQFDHYEAFGAKNFPIVKCKKVDDKNIQGEIFYKNNLEIKREINISSKKIEFNDTISGLFTDSHVEINLNFHPSIRIGLIDNNNKLVEVNSGINKYILKVITDYHFDFEIKNTKGWISDYYNCKDENQKIVFSFPCIKDKIQIKWFILW